MRLGIDLDGVVADFNTGWINHYNQEFGSDVSLNDVDRWDVIPSLTHFAHMGEFWRWAEHLDGASLFRHLEPYPDALPALHRLAKRHRIVIITTKPDFAIHDTYEWIAEHGVPTREIHITGRKWTVNCDAYLDDGPHNLEDLVTHRPESQVFRFVRPWNSAIEATIAVNSWREFEDCIDAL